MAESKYWWILVDMWGNTEMQYGNFRKAVDKCSLDNIVACVMVEFYSQDGR